MQRLGRFAPADVQVLLDPHPADLARAFDNAARALQPATGTETMFVFYFSGHSDGGALYPNGELMPLADVRDRLARVGARIRVGILDTCRGGSWTRAKGVTVGPPLDPADLVALGGEGTALVSSSSGLENAHEADSAQGSFFTHHLVAGLLGAADRSGDGSVTLQEAFDYAKERTVRDSAHVAVAREVHRRVFEEPVWLSRPILVDLAEERWPRDRGLGEAAFEEVDEAVQSSYDAMASAGHRLDIGAAGRGERRGHLCERERVHAISLVALEHEREAIDVEARSAQVAEDLVEALEVPELEPRRVCHEDDAVDRRQERYDSERELPDPGDVGLRRLLE